MADTTLLVSVTVDAIAVAGTISGAVRAAQVASVLIPRAPLAVLH